MATEQLTKNFCTYLGFDGTLPLGSLGRPGLGPGVFRREAILATEGQEGTLVRELADALNPIRTAPGETMSDGRCGRQGAIETMLTSWPRIPDCNYDLATALGGRAWIRQGKDWEYVDVIGEAVYRALSGGESCESVKQRIRSADRSLVSDHRSANAGNKVQKS